MNRSRPLAAVLLASAAVASIAPAYATTPRDRYQATYERVDDHNAGPYKDGVAGRNIADDGLANGKAASAQDFRDGIVVMRRMLHPAPPPAPAPAAPAAPSEPSAPATAYVPPATSSGSCPASMAGEASSPDAVNPSSGASGCYQVLPSTAEAMGAACDDVNSEACLAAICSAQGNSAWDASGATPCG